MTKQRATTSISLLIVALLATWGGWSRRWISDDGLIVLRTVRNLLAGNGPVFNAGERVETNTSTLWQYLIAAVGALSNARLESIAIYGGLALAVIGCVWATWGGIRLWGGARLRADARRGADARLGAETRGWDGTRRESLQTEVPRTEVLGAEVLGTEALGAEASADSSSTAHRGTLIENGTLIAPFGILIYLALPTARDFMTSGLEWGLAVFWLGGLWWALVSWSQGRAVYFIAFWAGLSWLIRPELALHGGIIGLVILWCAHSWRERAGILAAAIPVPLAYEIFRMGYYGLLVPHTAVAKSAAGSQWRSGISYVADFVRPYYLWIPVVLVIAVLLLSVLRDKRTWLVSALMLLCGGLHLLYIIRVGGDFMHGRMLLLPIFVLLLPVAVVPLNKLTGVVILAGLCWAGVTATRDYQPHIPDKAADLRIVDERFFWSGATATRAADNPSANSPGPMYAEDFLNFVGLNGFPEALAQARENNDAQIAQILVSEDPLEFSWITFPRDGGEQLPSLTFINLGMVGMNAPLDVRVLDSVGLSNPLAARQPRIEGARIGHDKLLPLEWQAADTDAVIDQLPPWINREAAEQARKALHSPEFEEFFRSYREPMSMKRFLANLKFALGPGRTLEFTKDPWSYPGGDAQIVWPTKPNLD